MKILIAEDDLSSQEITGCLMNNWGYEFDIAMNGQKAVELAKTNEGKYDLCMMDIDMPIMNGCEATKIIRRKMKYFPILAVSANLNFEDKYFEIGMDDFLEKSYNFDELHDKINELTVKSIKVDVRDNYLHIRKEMPMDQKHAKELRKLAEQGLCKINLRGIGDHNLEVIAHKNVPYKISQDFIGNNEEVSVFIDRAKDKPTECHLYKSSRPMPSIYIAEENIEEKLAKEDELLKNCTEMVTKKKEG